MSPRSEAILSVALPVVPLLAPLGVHFLLVCFVLLAGWLPATYYFSHLVWFIVGVWACHDKTSIPAVIAVIVVLLMTMLLDIVQLGLFFGPNENVFGGGGSTQARTWQFSAAMCIINFLFKPVTLALSCLTVYFRAGGSLGPLGGGGGADSYSTIHGSDGQQSE